MTRAWIRAILFSETSPSLNGVRARWKKRLKIQRNGVRTSGAGSGALSIGLDNLLTSSSNGDLGGFAGINATLIGIG